MLTDISGNSYTMISNNFISPIYTPQQLFQSGLTIWWDFNDRSTLYSDSGGTIPINNGDVIRYVRNKVQNYPLYDLRNPVNPTSATINNSSFFSANTINTNKNSHVCNAGNTAQAQAALRTLSGYQSTNKTAFTFSAFFRLTSTGTKSNIANFGTTVLTAARFSFITTPDNGLGVTGGLESGYLPVVNINVYVGGLQIINIDVDGLNTKNSGRYFSATFVLDNNRNFFCYINDNLITSGNNTNTAMSGVTLPIFRSASMLGYTFYGFGGSQASGSGFQSELNEVILSDGEALDLNGVRRMHNYFLHKYNFRNKPNEPIVYNGNYS